MAIEAGKVSATGAEWPVWEVFVQQGEEGSPHEHAGSVHAPDGEIALQNARDVYARRGKVKSIWVVPASVITASSPADTGPFFDPAQDKVYRHPQFYKVPRGVKVF
jgi:ring-1,2-phenylacetyl-CoA epoxidase subunit PaaB